MAGPTPGLTAENLMAADIAHRQTRRSANNRISQTLGAVKVSNGLATTVQINEALWSWITTVPTTTSRPSDITIFTTEEIYRGAHFLRVRLSYLHAQNEECAIELSAYPSFSEHPLGVREFKGGMTWQNIPVAFRLRFGIEEEKFLNWWTLERIDWLWVQSEGDGGKGLRDALWAGSYAWEDLKMHIGALKRELERVRSEGLANKTVSGCFVL